MIDKLFEEVRSRSTGGMVKSSLIKYCLLNGHSQIPSISEALGYSVPTVTKYISELCKEDILHEYGKMDTSKGRKPLLYGVNPNACYCIGVDIKQFSLSIGLTDFTGVIVKLETYNQFVFENTPEVLDIICSHLLSFMEQLPISLDKVFDVNINLSGRVDSKEGFSYSIFNFEDSDAPLASVLTERIGKPVFVENDTRAMAYGEYMSDFFSRYKNVLYINASWGIGLGIIIDGKIYCGKNGYAGEFGHMNVYKNERMCHCGKKGCLETEVSGRALHRKLLERIRTGESSLLSQSVKSGEEITLKDIIQAAANEDTLCIDLIEQMGSELGRQLSNLINVFNPEAVIIGGSMAQISDIFLPPIRQAIRKYVLKLISKDLVVETSHLMDDAGVIGSCMIARHKIFE